MGYVIESFSVSLRQTFTPMPLANNSTLFNHFPLCEKIYYKVPLTFKNTIVDAFSLCMPSADTIQTNKQRRGIVVRRR